MTPDDWQQVEDSWVNWREADLHNLRLRFAAVLLTIREHERKSIESGRDMTAADLQLWSVPKEEGF